MNLNIRYMAHVFENTCEVIFKTKLLIYPDIGNLYIVDLKTIMFDIYFIILSVIYILILLN